MRASSRTSPVTRWVERCLQCTVVIFSLVSPDNMAKHFESSLLDECCNRRLPSSRAHFRITVNMGCIYGMWRMLCRRYWSNTSKHLCDATVRLQMSVPYVITGIMYTLYNLILIGRGVHDSRFHSPGFHAGTCQLNLCLDILVISTTAVYTRSNIYKGIYGIKMVIENRCC